MKKAVKQQLKNKQPLVLLPAQEALRGFLGFSHLGLVPATPIFTE